MWELLLILVVALIVLGPNRLPKIARNIGKAIRTIRKASAEITATVTRELEASEEESPPLKERSHKAPAPAEQKEPEAGQPVKAEGEKHPG